MSVLYILDGHTPVPCDSSVKWGKWFQDSIDERRVAKDERDGIMVSTVFLALGCGYQGGLPVLFKTRVFGGKQHEEERQYSTWDEAVAGHEEMCRQVFPPER